MCKMSYFHLSETCSFDQIVEFPQSRILGKTLNIVEEVLLLCFKQLPVICDHKWLSPKWADILGPPQGCWWSSPVTTWGHHTPSSAAGCWSGQLCSEPHASCPHGFLGPWSPLRTHQKCPACGHRTARWFCPLVLQTTQELLQSHSLQLREVRKTCIRSGPKSKLWKEEDSKAACNMLYFRKGGQG